MSKNGIIVLIVTLCLIGGSAGILLYGKGGGTSSDDDISYEEGYPRTVEDFLGNKVTFNESPKRIVTGSLEYLVLLGPEISDRVIWSSSKPISATDANPLFGVFEDLEKLHTSGNLNTKTEEVIAKAPDLVLMSDAKMTKKELDDFRGILNSVGINVYYCSSGASYNDARECVENNLMPIAKIFNMEERAETLLNFIDTKTDELAERLSEVDTSVLKNVYIAGGAWMGTSRTSFLGSSATTNFPMKYLDTHTKTS